MVSARTSARRAPRPWAACACRSRRAEVASRSNRGSWAWAHLALAEALHVVGPQARALRLEGAGAARGGLGPAGELRIAQVEHVVGCDDAHVLVARVTHVVLVPRQEA